MGGAWVIEAFVFLPGVWELNIVWEVPVGGGVGVEGD